jgi:hypothetical protein
VLRVAVNGPLGLAARAPISAKQDDLVACCASSPDQLALRMQIAEDGKVVAVVARDESAALRAAHECAARVLRALEFNRANAPSSIDVSVRCKR